MTSLAIRYLNLKYRAQTLGRQSVPRVFVNSIPKSGTNLIVSLALAFGRMRLSGPVMMPRVEATDLAGRKGLIFGHVETFLHKVPDLGLDQGFLLVRDPAAYAISLARYIDVNTRHPAHKVLTGHDPETLILAVLEGMDSGSFTLEPVHERYARYIDNAQAQGFAIADFDSLLSEPHPGSVEDKLLRVLGGDDYAQLYPAALARSRETSTTYRHSQRAQRRITLPDALRAHPNLSQAQARYDASLHH